MRGRLYVSDLDEVPQKQAVIILADPVEVGQVQHLGGQSGRGQFPIGSQGAHGLMIEEAERQAVQPGRLHPFLFQIKLDQGDALQEFPRYGGRKQSPDLRLVLPHDEPHLRRLPPPAGPAHPLQEGGDGPRSVDLKGPFQLADVDSQLQGGGGDRRIDLFRIFHEHLGRLPVGGGEIPMVDEEAVRLMVQLAVMPQLIGHGLAFFPRVDEDQTFLSTRMLEDIGQAGIGGLRGLVGRLFPQVGGRGYLPASSGLLVFHIEVFHGQLPS